MLQKNSDNLFIIFALHLFLWIGFLAYPFVFGIPFRQEIIITWLLHSSLLMVFFYLNATVLIPAYLTQGRIALYFIAVFAIISIIITANVTFHRIFDFDLKMAAEMGRRHSKLTMDIRRIGKPLFSSLFIFAISTSYKLLLDWFKNERKKKQAENEKLLSELSFLKSQVSPHFLFNTLNNIYSLSLSNSQLTSDAILKLSQLLRYMLYESDVKQVSLTKEVQYLQNYIELQKMRLKDDIKVAFETNGDFSREPIEPMLLIPFIENAFKHGINNSKPSFVNISISITNGALMLKVENTNHSSAIVKDKDSGIGLVNVKRRLDLLYPEKHQLSIQETEKLYLIELLIKLREC